MSYLERLDRWLSLKIRGEEYSDKITRFFLCMFMFSVMLTCINIVNLFLALGRLYALLP